MHGLPALGVTGSALRTFRRVSVALAAIVMLIAGPALLDASAQRPPMPPSPERVPDASRTTGLTSASDSLQRAQQYVQQGMGTGTIVSKDG